jgi:diamine N-acetyltransferase
MLLLRRARETDIAFLVQAERGPGYDRLVGQSSAEDHGVFIGDPNRAVLIANGAEEPVGFVMCNGLTDRHNGVCLQRIVSAVPDRGIGTAMVPLVIDWVFAHTKAHRIWLDTLRHNERAQHVYRKIGFVDEGIFRDAYQMPDGSYADRFVMSVLRREWPGALRAE